MQKLMNPDGTSIAVFDLGIKAAVGVSIAGRSGPSVKAPTGSWRSARHPTINPVAQVNTIAVQRSAITATLALDGAWRIDYDFLTICGHTAYISEQDCVRNSVHTTSEIAMLYYANWERD
jgi:hypothetical protein